MSHRAKLSNISKDGIYPLRRSALLSKSTFGECKYGTEDHKNCCGDGKCYRGICFGSYTDRIIPAFSDRYKVDTLDLPTETGFCPKPYTLIRPYDY